MQEGVTNPSTLDASRLKIFFRSVDSDLESTSEIKKIEIAFSKKMQSIFEKIRTKNLRLSEKISFSKKHFRKKSVISQRILLRIAVHDPPHDD
jgi:hypothetical protein